MKLKIMSEYSDEKPLNAMSRSFFLVKIGLLVAKNTNLQSETGIPGMKMFRVHFNKSMLDNQNVTRS